MIKWVGIENKVSKSLIKKKNTLIIVDKILKKKIDTLIKKESTLIMVNRI